MMTLTEKIRIVLAVYLIGIPLAMIYLYFRLRGRIKIKGRLPVFEDGLILAYHHVFFFDPLLVDFLYFPWFLLNPFKFLPLSAVAKENYYDKKWFFFLRPACIPIKEKGVNKEFLVQVIRTLKKGKRVAIAPEGGRTGKGKEFLYSRNGEKIRKLENGTALLAIKTGAKVLPIWLEAVGQEFEARDISFSEILRLLRQLDTKTEVIVKIGEPFLVQGSSHQKATLEITQTFLELADKDE